MFLKVKGFKIKYFNVTVFAYYINAVFLVILSSLTCYEDISRTIAVIRLLLVCHLY